MSIITSLLVLSFLIFFHELGHFIAARFFGVAVEVFSIGFGRKVLTKKIGNTEYCLSMIPLGGYVQMKGQDDTDPTKISLDTDSYNTKKPWQRIIILFAGPFANFLLAFLLYIAIGNMGVTKLLPTIGAISKDSPALMGGLQKGDKIIAINHVPIQTWDELSNKIKNSQGILLFDIERQDKKQRIKIMPKVHTYKNMFGETLEKKMVGIAPIGAVTVLKLSFPQSINYAVDATKQATTMIVKSLQKLIEGVIPAKDLGGIVSIVQVTAEASKIGLVALFGLTALISVNLGVLNLLPIPALDGGHIMFNLYEMITKKAPSEKVLYYLTLTGWALLLSLMAFTIFNDIYRLIGAES
ncbi:RIP metalloprotease RseP [Sulfurospirillum sp. 1612]|uniref:RIP metalloprotease RseP n=1 Tax=Sulfurospirillum sp. 1612 TaxID=3094835 RepID=UPI002F94D7C8